MIAATPPEPAPTAPDIPFTAQGVLQALAHACRDYGIPYAGEDDDLWIVVSTPADTTSAGLAVVRDADDPKLIAGFKVTIEPVALPQAGPPEGVDPRPCPDAAAFPHPGHLWEPAGSSGFRTVPTPTADSTWCAGTTTTTKKDEQP